MVAVNGMFQSDAIGSKRILVETATLATVPDDGVTVHYSALCDKLHAAWCLHNIRKAATLLAQNSARHPNQTARNA